MKLRFIRGLAVATACTVVSCARASVATEIAVTDFRIQLSAIAPGIVPSASFLGLVGSTAECEVSSGDPLAEGHVLVSSGLPFGTVLASTSSFPFAMSAAGLAGDVFGAGATMQTSASASSLASQSMAQGTIGLVNDVAASSFTLTPWTVMTISANVRAFASSTGEDPFELTDSGVLMAIGDSEGSGPQWAYVNFNAFAFGGLGAMNDAEMAFLSLSYENDTAVPIEGLFSGYVSSFASSGSPIPPVPEPTDAAMLVVGALVVYLIYGRRCRRVEMAARRP